MPQISKSNEMIRTDFCFLNGNNNTAQYTIEHQPTNRWSIEYISKMSVNALQHFVMGESTK